MNDGEFFRRNPGDGQTYIFNGQEMSPRVAVQRIHFSSEHPTQIVFPTIDNTLAGSCDFYEGPNKINEVKEFNLDLSLFPNPATNNIHLFVNKPAKTNYNVVITNAIGNVIETRKMDDNIILNCRHVFRYSY